jgi:hypothetical protein
VRGLHRIPPHPCELSVQRTEVGLLMQHYGEVRSPFVDCDELSFIEDAPFHSLQQFILAKTPGAPSSVCRAYTLKW